MDVAIICERRMFPTRKRSWYSQSRLQTTARRLNMMVCARCFGRANLENIRPVIRDCMNTPKHDCTTSAKNEIRHCGWITRNLINTRTQSRIIRTEETCLASRVKMCLFGYSGGNKMGRLLAKRYHICIDFFICGITSRCHLPCDHLKHVNSIVYMSPVIVLLTCLWTLNK